MKPTSLLPLSLAAIALPLHAADLTWDNGAATGNWNTTDANWTGSIWNNTAPDNAFFNTNTGTVTLTEAITAGNLTFGLTNANLSGSFAGSALTVNGSLTVRADDNNGAGHLALSLSNTVNVLGDVAINRSVMQITGGTFAANRIGSTNAWGRLLVSGGLVTATNGVDDSVLGNGLAMSVFLEGGTLSTPYLKTTSATWTGLGNDGVVLNGGTLQATDSSNDFIQVWDPSTWGIRNNVGVGPNGANIDTNGFDITINRTLENYGGAGTLTKDGLGKLTLVWSGHTGGTTVNAGTLEYVANSGYSLLRNTLTVNAGGTVSVLGDGTGLGWQGGHMVTTLNINGGTVTSPGTMHVWQMGGGVNMTGGTLQSNDGTSDADGPQLEWINSTVNTNASADTATIGGRIRMRGDGGAAGITFNVADGAAASDLLVSAAITEAWTPGMGIIKNGAGTMTITGASTYSGGTVINGGVLEVGSVAGATSNIGSQWLALDNTSTLRYTGSGSESTSRDIWVNNAAGTRTFDVANASGVLTLTGGGGQISKDIRKAGAGTLVLDKVVSDSASVTADGGTLTLTAANTYSGITTISAGTLEVGGSAGSLGSGNVVNDAALVFNRSTDHTVGNAISGTGSVTQSGAGITTLSGTNTYTGATSVTAGGLNLTGSLASNVTVSGGDLSGEGSTTGSLTFTGTSTLGFDPSTGTFLSAGSADATGGTVTLVPSISMSGTGIVVLEALGGITGGGNFVFSGRGSSYLNVGNTQLLFDFTPGTVVWKGNDGTNPTFWDVNTTTNWELGGSPDKFFLVDAVTFDDTATGYDVAVQGASVTAGNITFDNTTTYTVSGGGIAGTGSLTKSNAGTVILRNANTFTGATTINAGTLQLGDGTGGNDGSLATSGITNSGTLAYNLNGNQTAGYAISGSGALTKAGAGTLTLTAANSYSGGTTVNGGILQAGNAGAFGDSGSTITVNSGGALDLNGQNLQAYTNAIVLNGAGIDADTGALFNSGSLQLNGVRSISLGSNVAIGGNGGRFDLGRDHTGTVNQGNGFVLTKVGGNTVAILNTSAGLSGVVIKGGTLTAETDDSLATAPITINGGALGSWGGRTLGNTVNLAGAGGVDVQGGDLTLTGVVDGAGSLSKTGGNNLYLTGNNTLTGTLSVSGGHVRFASTVGNATQGNVEMLNPGSFLIMNQPNQFGPNSGLLFNSSGGHNEFALYGHNQTLASLASTNQFAVVQNSHGGFGAASANSTLTVNQGTDTVYYGVFRDSTGNDSFTLALVKEGAGKLTLATNTSHTGGTTVNAGVLEINGSSGGNGYLRGTVTVNTGAELRYAGGDGTGFGYNGGNKLETLNINGGTVSTPGTAHVWNLSGGVNMTGGTLQSNNGTSDANGPQLEWINANVTTNASASSSTIAGRIRMRGDGGATGISFTVADGEASSDLVVSAAITEASGGLGITKAGAGTMLISGANTYTGGTSVYGGILSLGGSGSISSGNSLTLGSGGTFRLEDTASASFSIVDGGNGNGSPGHIVQTGGTLTVNGDFGENTSLRLGHWPDETSTYQLSGGTLQITNPAGGLALGTDGEGVFTMAGGTLSTPRLDVNHRDGNGSGTFTLDGGTAIIGSGGINTAGGPATVNLGGGILAASAAWSSSVPMNLTGAESDAVFDTSGGDISLSGVLSGPGGLLKNGSGTLALSVANTYTGNTSVAAGTLSVAGPNFADASTVSLATGAVLHLAFAGDDTVASLVLNGVTQPGGTYNATTHPAFFTGTGSISVPITNPILPWRNTQFTLEELGDTLLEATVWGDNADPDGDGLSNALEFALGTQAKTSDGASRLPTSNVVSGALTLAYRRPVGGVSGVTYGVEFRTTDLAAAGWTAATSPADYTQIITANGDGTETVTITLTAPVTGKTFARISVSY